MTTEPTEKSIAATFIRGGTSKGIFLNWRDIPEDPKLRDRILLAVLGSPDAYGRQLDGMGGGISSLSKVMMVRASDRDDIDAEYLFAQVAVDEAVVDYSANCGNLTSAVAMYARQEGIIPVDRADPIRLLNLNTGKVVHSYTEDRRIEIPGVSGLSPAIRLDFRDPGGTTTGKLLPTGRAIDELKRRDGTPIKASLIDAAIPMVFVSSADFPGLHGTEAPDTLDGNRDLAEELEHIRRQAAVAMGLARQASEAPLAAPKIAVVSPPSSFTSLDGNAYASDGHDITVRTVSMGKFHRAVPLTSAMCTGVARGIEGSIPNHVSLSGQGILTRLGTPSGVLEVSAGVSLADDWRADFAGVYRTARRLMTGDAYYRLD